MVLRAGTGGLAAGTGRRRGHIGSQPLTPHDAVPPPSAGERVVCVLGMGRSGTSLTMRVLNLLGVELGRGEDLLEPLVPDNPAGYWEQRPIMMLNEEILAALGGSWFSPPPLDTGWERSPMLDPLRERARTLLSRQFAGP